MTYLLTRYKIPKFQKVETYKKDMKLNLFFNGSNATFYVGNQCQMQRDPMWILITVVGQLKEIVNF